MTCLIIYLFFCSLFFPLIATEKLKDENFDCLLLVIDKLDGLPAYLQGIKSEIENYQKVTNFNTFAIF